MSSSHNVQFMGSPVRRVALAILVAATCSSSAVDRCAAAEESLPVAVQTELPAPDSPKVQRRIALLDRADRLWRDGRTDGAVEAQRQALAIAEELFGADSYRVEAACAALADYYAELGDFTNARAYSERELEISRRRSGPDSWQAQSAETRARLINKLETVDAYDRRQYFEAERSNAIAWRDGDYELALRSAQLRSQRLAAWLGTENQLWADASIQIFDALIWLGETEGLVAQLEKRLVQFEAVFGPYHPATATTRVTLADLLERAGENERAVSLYAAAIADFEAAGDVVGGNYSVALNNLATVLDELKQYDEAIPNYRKAAGALELDTDPADKDFRTQRQNLAISYESAGWKALSEWRLPAALEYYRQAEEQYQALFGPAAYQVFDVHKYVVLIRELPFLSVEQQGDIEAAFGKIAPMVDALDAKKYERAVELATERANLLQAALGEYDLNYADALLDVGYYVTWLNDDAKVVEIFLKLEKIYDPLLPAVHPLRGQIDAMLAYRSEEPLAQRIARSKRALEVLTATLGRESSEYAEAAVTMGELLLDAGRAEEALEQFQQAIRTYRILYQTNDNWYCTAVYDMARANQAVGRDMQAEPYFREALLLSEKLYGRNTEDYSIYANELANLLYSWGDYEHALKFYEAAVNVNELIGLGQTSDTAIKRNNLARDLLALGKLDAARAALTRTIEFCRTTTDGAEPLRDALLEIAALQEDAEQYDDALASLDEATEATATLNGRRSLEYAEVLRRRGELLFAQGREEEARAAWDEAWELLQDIEREARTTTRAELTPIGEQIDLLATTLSDNVSAAAAVDARELAYRVYQRVYDPGDWRLVDYRVAYEEARRYSRLEPELRQRLEAARASRQTVIDSAAPGNFDEYRQMAEETVSVYREALGEDSRELGDLYESLADVARTCYRHSDAKHWYEAALDSRQRVLGHIHPSTATALQDLGRNARDLQQFDQSFELLKEALAVLKELWGEEGLNYASTQHTLAISHLYAGNPAAALPLVKESLETYRRLYGEESYEYSNVLNTLATTYDELDQTYRAAVMLVDVMNINRRVLGEDDPRYWDSVLVAAQIASRYPEPREAARQRVEEVIKFRAESIGVDHPEYADAIVALAQIHRFDKRYAEAADLYRQVVRIREKTLGPTHPRTAGAYEALGVVLEELGDLDQAATYLGKSYQIQKRLLGAEHPDLAITAGRMARLAARTQRFDEAATYAQRCLEINRREIEKIAAWTTEEGVQSIVDEGDDAYDLLLSLAVAQPDNKAVVQAAIDWTLRRKGAVLDALCSARSTQRLLAYEPGVAMRIDQLRELQQREADLTMSGADAEQATQLDQVQTKINELQESIAADLEQRGVKVQSLMDADATAVQAALGSDETLIEYICWRPFDFDSGEWRPNHYLALVAPGGAAEWSVHELGSIRRVNALIERLRVSTRQAQRELQMADEADLAAEYDQTSHKLYEALFAPLAESLADKKRVIVAPDGFLHTAPLGTLAVANGRYFVEQFDLAYLNSGRDLLRPRQARGRGTLIFANPDFDLDAVDRKLTLARLNTPAAPGEMLAMRSAMTDATRGLQWKELVGTAVEAEQIESALVGSGYEPVTVYTGATALEDVLKSALPPRILHVATHGFFLSKEESDGGSESRGEVGAARTAASRMSRLRSQQNALLRSGIVLAGANRFADPSSGGTVDDGWLTAMEIASLDLDGVELAVLSACNTGMGDVEAGEGVQGLQRALVHAGVQSLVTSLFEVPDHETQQLMTEFYRRLHDGESTLAAFSGAQRALIAQRREANGAAHPFYWGSFVLVGMPR
ncbi:MAG: tetratricopeptide repeat protein [Planctomycetales bacterium]|nr:tetratricopeptide repeat protein [Planctomycetales bacterium]